MSTPSSTNESKKETKTEVKQEWMTPAVLPSTSVPAPPPLPSSTPVAHRTRKALQIKSQKPTRSKEEESSRKTLQDWITY